MGASLKWDVSKSYTDTTCKISVVLYVVSTSGSWNGDARSGYVTIAGTKHTFSHSFSANTTTKLASVSQTVSRGTSDKTVALKAAYSTGVSAGTITKTGSVTVADLPTYTVTFNKNGGTATTTKTVYHGHTTTYPSSAGTKTGYTFKGWSTSSSATSGSTGTTPAITSNRTYYAAWLVNTYTVTFNANGGSPNTTRTPTYGGSLTAPTTPTRDGYDFIGWGDSLTSTTAVAVPSTWTTAGNKTYYAIWELAYVKPAFGSILSTRIKREGSTSILDEDGTYARFIVNWTNGKNADQSVAPVNGIDILRKIQGQSDSYYSSIFGGKQTISNTGSVVQFSADDISHTYDTSTVYNIKIILYDANNVDGVVTYDFITKSSYIWRVPSDASKFQIGVPVEVYGDYCRTDSNTITLGAYRTASVLTTASTQLFFSIPTGRVYPSNYVIKEFSCSILGRASSSNTTGLYIMKASSGSTDAGASFIYGQTCTCYNAANNQIEIPTSFVYNGSTVSGQDVILSGGTNINVMLRTSTSYGFAGNSTNSGYVNNNTAMLMLSHISFKVGPPTV